jgi:hypothetical protein
MVKQLKYSNKRKYVKIILSFLYKTNKHINKSQYNNNSTIFA